MSIKRGRAWGDTGPFPADGVVASSDADARDYVISWRAQGTEFVPIGLSAGDLCATLGGRGGPQRFAKPGAELARVLVDVGRVSIDDQPPTYFVAHCIARRSWWRGRVVAVMNAAWLGEYNVAPRAHPGDGRFDLVDANLALGDRFKARKRLRIGTHVPHPHIATSSFRETSIEFDRPTRVWLDGRPCGVARTLQITVEAEALRVLV